MIPAPHHEPNPIDRTVEALQSVPTVLNGEKLIGLFAAARLVPGHRGGEHVNTSTILRWIAKGIGIADGTRIRLAGTRCGSRWLTSVEAVARFCAALTAASLPPSEAPPAPRSPASRRNAQASAARELDRLGIK